MPLILKALATLALLFFAVEYAERYCRKAVRTHPYNLDDQRLAKLFAVGTACFAFLVVSLAIWSR